ncbi:MAG: metallophosphoesterase [Candidatus Kapabacteria bacterium]|jgi:hypothetical protein|nr:metallophosphoesterase [Candidatus Kapabacteria bacterium]
MTVEFSWRLLLFFVVVGALQTALDLIVLGSWRKYVQKRGWRRVWYLVPITLGIIMFFVFPYTVYLRQIEWHPSPLNKFLHKTLAVWYIPKIPIAVLLVANIMVKWLQTRFNARVVLGLETALDNLSAISFRLIWQGFNRRFQAIFSRFLRYISLWNILLRKTHTNSSNASIAPHINEESQIQSAKNPTVSGFRGISLTSEVNLARRAFLTRTVNMGGYALAAAPVAALGADALFTLYDFDVQRVAIPINNLPAQFHGMTIAQLSDIHAGSFFSEQPMQEVCRIVESLKPDLMLITGDWVNWRAAELPLVLPQIQRLCAFAARNARFGLWGCLGNHDHYSSGAAHAEILSTLRGVGVNLLVNQNTTFCIDGAALQLAAIDNVGLRQNYGRLDKALETLSPENPTILMAHDPTFWDKKIHAKPHETVAGNLLVDLTLSGHTHGGQMGINLFGMDITPAALMYKQVAGLYADDYSLGQHIYVNRGIGTTGIPIRLGVPPEITLITLVKA